MITPASLVSPRTFEVTIGVVDIEEVGVGRVVSGGEEGVAEVEEEVVVKEEGVMGGEVGVDVTVDDEEEVVESEEGVTDGEVEVVVTVEGDDIIWSLSAVVVAGLVFSDLEVKI